MTEEAKKQAVEMGTPAPVAVEVPAAEEKPKRGRPRKKTKGEEHHELEQNVKMMLVTMSGMAASRNPIWKLSAAEIDAVAKPASRILARLGAEEEANKNADYVLLAVGVAGIIIPRIMIMKAKGGVKRASGQPGPEQPESTTAASSGKVAATSPWHGRNNVKQLLPGLA